MNFEGTHFNPYHELNYNGEREVSVYTFSPGIYIFNRHPRRCLCSLRTTVLPDALMICRRMSICGFPDSSVGKESACNAGDPGSIPGLGKSTGEGIGCPLQYSWASLVAQLVKSLPAMRETWVRSLGWEHPLEKGKVTLSSILVWRILWTV